MEVNKRVALVAMRTFLVINGYGVDVSQEEKADWTLSLSAGLSVERLADRIRPALRVEPPTSEEG